MGRDLIWDPDEGPPTTHVVEYGENLTTIAAKYDATWQALYDRNYDTIGPDPNKLTTGAVLAVDGLRPVDMLADAGFVDIGRTQDGVPWVVTGGGGSGGWGSSTTAVGASGSGGGRGGGGAGFVTFDEVQQAMAQVPAVGGLIAGSIQFRPQADELVREVERKKLAAELERQKRFRANAESAEILQAALFQKRAEVFQGLTIDYEPFSRLQRSIGSALEAMKALTMTPEPGPTRPEPPKPSTKTPFWAQPLNLKGKRR